MSHQAIVDPTAEAARPMYIREYRVEGAQQLPKTEIERAVYPFLGPGRGEEDVEQARAALEKAYQAEGYQTATVQIPPQQVKGGIVILQVLEGKVGRLRVKGARYFSPAAIKRQAASLAEGKVVDFNQVTRDIVALNQIADRRVTPSLRAGSEPGTVDIDLDVKDSLPLHGSLELNNRYSADTTPLRVNASLSYNNLWQLGHTLGANFQISPQDLNEVKVYSGYYLARVPGTDWNVMLQGTKQDSNVSTLGGIDSAGRGEVIGARAILALPTAKDFFHSVSLGIDYKHFNQTVTIANTPDVTPISYYPLSAAYSGTWTGKDAVTEFNTSLNFHLRGMGSGPDAFDRNRIYSDGNYLYLRGDLSHTHDLFEGCQIFGKVQGQVSDQPLINSEQISGGGLGTVRGYLESEVLGDNAVFGSIELRSPQLRDCFGGRIDDWRFYTFGDAGVVTLNSPLPEQTSRFNLASVGVGSRVRFLEHLNGSFDLAFPLIGQSAAKSPDWLCTFRIWADF